jgi:phage gp36-like protein
MPFASRSDLLQRANAQRLAQLAVPTDRERPADKQLLRRAIECGDIGEVSGAEREAIDLALTVIDKALADADALILSYGVPADIPVTPPLLARISSTIALYYLHGAEKMPDTVAKSYEAVIKMLDKWGKGELPGLVPAAPEQPGGMSEITSSPRRYR